MLTAVTSAVTTALASAVTSTSTSPVTSATVTPAVAPSISSAGPLPLGSDARGKYYSILTIFTKCERGKSHLLYILNHFKPSWLVSHILPVTQARDNPSLKRLRRRT